MHLKRNKSVQVAYLVGSQLITQVVDKAIMVTLIWYITQHYSKIDLSVFLGVIMLPYFINLPFVHKIADHISYLKIARFAEISRALFFITAYILLKNHIYFSMIMVIAFFKNFAASFFDPVILSIPSRLKGSVSNHRLMSLMNSGFAIGAIAGPVVAITVNHFYKIDTLFLVSAIFYALSFVLLGKIKLQEKLNTEVDYQKSESMLKKLFRILEDAKAHIGVFIVYSAIMNLLLAPLQLLIPLLVKHVHHNDFSHYSGLQISMGVGAIAGSLLSGFIVIRKQYLTGIYGLSCYLLSACFYVLLAYQKLYVGSLFSIFTLDLFMSAGNVFIMSHFQKNTENKLLPALMSCVVFISVALSPLAMFIAGIGLHYFDVQTILHIYAFSAVLLTAITIILVSRNLEATGNHEGLIA